MDRQVESPLAGGWPGTGPAPARSRPWLAPALVIALLAPPAGLALWAHNAMLGRSEAVEAAWAQVESNLQRRADLLPRLVETVSRAMRHEAQVLASVTELRRAQLASGRQLAALRGSGPSDPRALESVSRLEADVGRGVQSVLAVAEAYPQLRSADQFLELQAQLEGTENRINVARMAYNDAVRDYNAALVKLPTRFVASSRGLQRKVYFRAAESAREAGPLAFD